MASSAVVSRAMASRWMHGGGAACSATPQAPLIRAEAEPLAACTRCERLGREQLATLLTIVAAAGERAWRARSVAAAWGEIIGKVHTGCTGLQPGGAWHGVAA